MSRVCVARHVSHICCAQRKCWIKSRRKNPRKVKHQNHTNTIANRIDYAFDAATGIKQTWGFITACVWSDTHTSTQRQRQFVQTFISHVLYPVSPHLRLPSSAMAELVGLFAYWDGNLDTQSSFSSQASTPPRVDGVIKICSTKMILQSLCIHLTPNRIEMRVNKEVELHSGASLCFHKTHISDNWYRINFHTIAHLSLCWHRPRPPKFETGFCATQKGHLV